MMNNQPRQSLDAGQLAAIRQLVADAERHQNKLEPFLALHTADTAIVNIAGRRVLGKDDLRVARAAALASPLAQVRTRQEIVDIRAVGPEVAIVSCVKHVFDERDAAMRHPGDAHLPTRGSLTYIVVRDKGDWRIALAQTTPRAGT